MLNLVLTLYLWIIIARALLSWVNPDPRNPIVRFLHNATEPILYPVRRALPYMGGVDLSPLVVIVAIYFLQIFLVGEPARPRPSHGMTPPAITSRLAPRRATSRCACSRAARASRVVGGTASALKVQVIGAAGRRRRQSPP